MRPLGNQPEARADRGNQDGEPDAERRPASGVEAHRNACREALPEPGTNRAWTQRREIRLNRANVLPRFSAEPRLRAVRLAEQRAHPRRHPTGLTTSHAGNARQPQAPNRPGRDELWTPRGAVHNAGRPVGALC
jgi:hypothetical protein